MRSILLIVCLFIITSCNDNLRTRVRPQALIGDGLTSLSGEIFRKMYIAEVVTPILVGQSQLVFKEAAQDLDSDFEYICDIDVSSNKKFNFIIQDNELILKDGISTLILNRVNGSDKTSLIGSWKMKETTRKVITETELIFNTLDDLKIRKTCKLL